jgi:hypothetical protein
MIRRDVRLADGSAAWMLISQVEHARISAQLAEYCGGRFGAISGEVPAAASNSVSAVRNEVLAAVRCHDDGWAQWEQCPRLDPTLHRPLSFMELEPAEAIAIWMRSITSAEQHGPLAAGMVAGHFLRLLRKWEAALREASTRTWLEETERRRLSWIAAWQLADPAFRTWEVADEALQWLWTFDEVSLWFCCSCPDVDDSSAQSPKPYVAGLGAPLEMTLVTEQAAVPACGFRQLAIARPYRFNASPIEIQAAGRVVKSAQYADCHEMLAAAEPKTLHWRLQA